MQRMQLYTTSRATCFQRCKREHYYSYELMRRPRKEALALSFGKLYHDALEAWRKMIMDGMRDGNEVLQAVLELMDQKVREQQDTEMNVFEYQRARVLFVGYHTRWFEHDTHALQYVFVEQEFTAPMINPATGAASRTWQLGGKIDGGAIKNGRNWTVESKTTSSDIAPGSEYWLKLRMDSQVSTYQNGAVALGFIPHGCIYDVSRKPQQQPYKATPEENRRFTKGKSCKGCRTEARERGEWEKGAPPPPPNPNCASCEQPRLSKQCREHDETPEAFGRRLIDAIVSNPDAYYQRGEVIRLDDEMLEFDHDQWLTGRALRESQLADAWPRNPNACVRYGRTCSYWDVCTGADSIDNDDRFRTSGSQHEELELTPEQLAVTAKARADVTAAGDDQPHGETTTNDKPAGVGVAEA